MSSAATKPRFAEEELDLIRQAVKNQGDDENRAVLETECPDCQRRARREFDRRAKVRASALKKIQALRG